MAERLTAHDVIAVVLSGLHGNAVPTFSERTDFLIKELGRHGYIIIKDRSDLEGGIPGRQL